MKRSAIVTLVVSGALLTGCDNKPVQPGGYAPGVVLTNNTFQPDYGYWHAPFHQWYPYPYNYFRPGLGYYAGGRFWGTPYVSAILSSAPRREDYYRGGGGSFWTSRGTTTGGGGSDSAGHGSSISRGGFGASGHASSSS